MNLHWRTINDSPKIDENIEKVMVKFKYSNPNTNTNFTSITPAHWDGKTFWAGETDLNSINNVKILMWSDVGGINIENLTSD